MLIQIIKASQCFMALLAIVFLSGWSSDVDPASLCTSVDKQNRLLTTREFATTGVDAVKDPANGIVSGGAAALPGQPEAGGHYIVVDLDNKTTTDVGLLWRTAPPPGEARVKETFRKHRDLSREEFETISAEIRKAWTGETPPQFSPVMDFFGGVAIFCGDQVLKTNPRFADAWPKLDHLVQELWYTFETKDRVTRVSPRPE